MQVHLSLVETYSWFGISLVSQKYAKILTDDDVIPLENLQPELTFHKNGFTRRCTAKSPDI